MWNEIVWCLLNNCTLRGKVKNGKWRSKIVEENVKVWTLQDLICVACGNESNRRSSNDIYYWTTKISCKNYGKKFVVFCLNKKIIFFCCFSSLSLTTHTPTHTHTYAYKHTIHIIQISRYIYLLIFFCLFLLVLLLYCSFLVFILLASTPFLPPPLFHFILLIPRGEWIDRKTWFVKECEANWKK